jgi:aspartyl-tRNA(Asn)/glutamyl-tRNA(Gln) amidotransferase subunit A
MPNSFTFDHCGPLAWTAEDCAIVLRQIAGHDPADPTSSRRAVPDYQGALRGDIRGLRIGVLRHLWEDEVPVAEESRVAIEYAIEVFASLGAVIGEARMRTRREYNDVLMVISKPETLAIHEKALRERPQDFGADFLGRILPGCLLQATDYVRAQRERRRMIEEMGGLYERFDVLLAATNAPAERLDAERVLLSGGRFRIFIASSI